jgi:hypothetical protein
LEEGRPLERILFRDIGAALQRVVHDAGIKRLLILIDEWTAVPAELQPLLAEFLKRSLFPYPRITVKLAAIEHRCCLSIPLPLGNTLGFERGADIAGFLTLDDFFVYDLDEQQSLDLFAEVLFRHVAAESDNYWLSGQGRPGGLIGRAPRELVQQFAASRYAEPYYLQRSIGIKDGTEFTNAFFKGDAFRELVLAGQGIARDFMYLFQEACFDTIRRKKVRIDVSCVRQVARAYFALDKFENLDTRQRALLMRMVNTVVGRHRSRSFMFDQELDSHSVVRSLFDQRVVHLVRRGFIPEGEDIGRQYNVYTLDYGTYVGVLGTERAPRGDFSRELVDDGTGLVYPFNDGRGMKRIVLPPELLEN